MNHTLKTVVFITAAIGAAGICKADPSAYWPRWRGPLATGVAPDADPPVEWDESKNVKWKADLPGTGISSPVVWNDRLFVTTAIRTERTGSPPDRDALLAAVSEERRDAARTRSEAENHVFQFAVLAMDRETGRTLWQHVCTEQVPHETGHSQNTLASGSPVTDGTHVFAHFGSYGTCAYDVDGKLIWRKDLGDMLTRRGFGEGSSPALHDNTLVITWDHEADSFIVALDKNTGKELWRNPRDEPTSWATPLVLETDARTQVIANGTNRIRSYDLKTGRLLWQCGGMTTNAIPTPVADDKLAYIMSGFRGAAVRAVPYATAEGDITDSATLAWTYDQDTPYVPSPVLYDGLLYFTKGNTPILTCLEARTGKTVYGPTRIEGIREIYASPVAAGGRIYITGRDGETVVIKAGRKFEILATNKLDAQTDATPAVVGKVLYTRGRQRLYAIGGE